MNNWGLCWFFMHIFTGDFNFKGFTAQHLYKLFGIKGLIVNKMNKKCVTLVSQYLFVWVYGLCWLDKGADSNLETVRFYSLSFKFPVYWKSDISPYQCLLLECVRILQLWQYFGDKIKGTVCLIFRLLCLIFRLLCMFCILCTVSV
jgi:hypothetical protein